MENVFEEFVANSTTAETPVTESTESTTVNESDYKGSEYDLDLSDLTEDTQSVEEEETEEDVVEEEVEIPNPTNTAFAQMRVQNKEYSEKLNAVEEIIKNAGLKDIDEFIAKSKEAQIRKQAAEQGIPEEVARELSEMREFRNSYEREKQAAVFQQKEQNLVGNLTEFITNNGLSDGEVKKLSDALAKDGFTTDRLVDYPKAALNRILSSYYGAGNQKNLEKKDSIKNELPLSQSTKIDVNTLNKEIDALARQFAGK